MLKWIDWCEYTWWWTDGVAGFIPFMMLGVTNGRPLFATAFYAGLVFLLCILETTYTHIICKRLSENTIPELSEQHPILGSSKDADMRTSLYCCHIKQHSPRYKVSAALYILLPFCAIRWEAEERRIITSTL